MEEKGITQVQLAKAAKVSQAAVSKWTNGALPETAKIIELSRYFKVPFSRLIGATDDESDSLYNPAESSSAGGNNLKEYRSQYGSKKSEKSSDAILAVLIQLRDSFTLLSSKLDEIIKLSSSTDHRV
jgi:transcriptional regulator with XRE-family HTH domain